MLPLRNNPHRTKASERTPLTDDEFLQRLAPPPADKAMVLNIRKCLAEMCRVPATAVYDTDDFAYLLPMMSYWTGWDDMNFVFRLERILGCQVAMRPSRIPKIANSIGCFLDPRETHQVGRWIRCTARQLRNRLGNPFQ